MVCTVCKGKKKIINYYPSVSYSCPTCKGKGKLPDPKGVNNTTFAIAQISSFEPIFTVHNEWRQREVTVYKHPTDENKVVSVGIPFGCGINSAIICEENVSEWKGHLDENRETGRVYFIYK